MTTKQSALTVVRMAQEHAQTELRERGHIRPGVFMLAAFNPQTGAKLSQATAIGTVHEEGFAQDEERVAFLDAIRSEAQRLGAQAIALCLQANAEVEGQAQMLPVAVIHIEDHNGVTLLHAPVERDHAGLVLGAFVAMEGAEAMAASGIELSLLPT